MLAPAENVPITVEETSVSAVDVISMSMHNLIAFVSSYRPWWSEFLAFGSIDRPTSFSSAFSRVKLNLRHFTVNYFLLTAASVTLFLIGDPTALLTVASFAVMWLLLYFHRDHPLVLCGRHISDRLIVVGLILGSLWALWFANCLQIKVWFLASLQVSCFVWSTPSYGIQTTFLYKKRKLLLLPFSFIGAEYFMLLIFQFYNSRTHYHIF